jgi:hypothetical protein
MAEHRHQSGADGSLAGIDDNFPGSGALKKLGAWC